MDEQDETQGGGMACPGLPLSLGATKKKKEIKKKKVWGPGLELKPPDSQAAGPSTAFHPLPEPLSWIVQTKQAGFLLFGEKRV